MNKIKVLELFGGIASFSKGLERNGVPYEIVDYVDIDKYATQAFNAIHGTNYEPQDITQWDKDIEVDMVCHGSPCLTADSLILTRRGYIPLAEVEVGDDVLTKSNTWHTVEKKFDNGLQDTLFLQGLGFENIHCTREHKFWARTSRRVGHLGKRVFNAPEFVEAQNLVSSKHYLGVPVIETEKEWISNDKEFWYLVGLYLGDGWLKKGKGYDVVFGLNEAKFEKLKQRVDISKWGITSYNEGSMVRVRFANKDFYKFIEKYIKTGSFEKTIPIELIELPKPLLELVYQGYLDSDGCERKDGNTVQFSSVNRGLLYAMGLIVNKLFHRPVRLYKNVVNPKKIIQGREVNQHDWYMLRFTKGQRKREQAFYENGYIWYRCGKTIEGSKQRVYNMQVNTDHSYIVQGCISKNCQDYSVAGRGAGGDKGSGTRSSLMWHTVRIVEKLKPKYVLWENVKNLLSKKHRHNFDAYIQTLDELGYNSYYQVLNAKKYGVPQNRERVFTVSIRKDIDAGFEFPVEIPLQHKLKDVLETDVDERFYLSQERVEKIKFSTYNASNYASRVRSPEGESRTLAARDYKDPTCVQVGVCEAINGNDILKRIYSADGVAPTCNTCSGGNTETKIVDPQGGLEKVNTPMAVVDDTYANRDARVYDDSAPTLRSERSGLKVVVGDNLKPIEETPAIIQKQGDRGTNNYSVSSETSYTIPANPMSDRDQKVVEPFIVASRGRNPDNPSDRTVGAPTEQRLEAHTDGVSNTLTSVQKDNYVGEFLPVKNSTAKGYLEGKPYDGIYTNIGNKRDTVQPETSQTLTRLEDKGVILPGLRVRKLTPKEYWRLMNRDDWEFDKAKESGISNSQLYKIAGNSIVVACPTAIFSQLFCEHKWNDMTDEERQKLVESEIVNVDR